MVPVLHFVLQAKNVWQTMIVNPRTAMVLLCCVKLAVVVTEFIMETKDVLMEEKIVWINVCMDKRVQSTKIVSVVSVILFLIHAQWHRATMVF